MNAKTNVTKFCKAALMAVFCVGLLCGNVFGSSGNAGKPSPDEVVSMLKAGNARFVSGNPEHPHTDAARLHQAGTENQGDHAYATVITCLTREFRLSACSMPA